jgi:CHAT domain-containing protein/tetratricopeptide (TPR) repeat protein
VTNSSVPSNGAGSDRLRRPPAQENCPDAETLAVYADGNLSEAYRSGVERHLSECDACFEVFSETFGVERADRKQARRAWPRVMMACSAAGIAAAAALLLFVFPGAFMTSPVRPDVAELVAAVGTARIIEPRVSGGFAYGPLKSPVRSAEAAFDASSPDVRIALARIERRVEESDRPEDVATLGVAYLSVGNAGKAITALEETTDIPTPAPHELSDLAAAYLVVGDENNQSQDIAKALSAAERAVTSNPALVEASFNRALALERLSLSSLARQAWEDYLKLDSRSGWSDEARHHVSSLNQAIQARTGTVERGVVERAARGANAAMLEDVVRRFPQISREWAEAELLNAWPQAYLAGRDAQAVNSLAAARRVGDALARETGDPFLQDAVSAIERTTGIARQAAAAAHQTFGEAMRKYEEDARIEATRLFETTLGPLERAGSPFALWTRLQLAIGAYFAGDLKGSSARLEAVLPAAEYGKYIRLLGLTLRMRGLLRGVQGQFPEQLREYRLALRSFERARDQESVAAIHASLAENMDNLGEPQRGWFHRSAALAGLSDVRRFRRRQAMLVGSATACLQQGLPYAALAFQAAALENAREWNQPGPITEAYLLRAETHHILGLPDQALADLAQADSWLQKLGDDRFASRVRAQIQLAAGEIRQRAQPDVSVSDLTSALKYFENTGMKWASARAYLARGRAHIAGHRLKPAADDFGAGIQAFEDQRAAVRDESLRVAYFDQPWDLFTEMIRLKAIHQAQPEAALTYAEQSRSRTLLEAMSRSSEARPSDPAQVRVQLPRATTLVYYSVLADSVLGWVIQHDGISFFQRPIRESELTRLIADGRSDRNSRSDESLKKLYDELIRPVRSTLGRERELVIVPDRVLHTVPFAALIDRSTGRYLIQDYTVAITPSISIFLESARTPPPRLDTALVVGNPMLSEPELQLPDLAGAQAEAQEIAALYQKADLMTGPIATKERFLDRLGRQDVVHFAGHALSNDSYPERSRLLLAAGTYDSSGSLFAHEIARSNLKDVRVVVLGGCRTSGGLIRRGEGVMSLARPFLAAGVPAVIATLWDVNDNASRTLFVEFHRAMRRGSAPVDALRQAQLRLLESGSSYLARPVNWAGVVAIGGIAGWRASGGSETSRSR